MYKRTTLSLLILVFGTLVLYSQKLDTEKLTDLKARSIGPAGMSGRVTAIDVVNDDPSIMYIGTASGGVWKSTSGGVDWKPIFDKEKITGIGSLAIDQSNPDVIWVGTGEGNPRNSMNHGYGIYKSLDAGNTWMSMGLEKTRNIHRVIIDPTNSNVVYAGAIGSPWGTQQERGVYKTTDGGKSWKKILYTNESSGTADMVIDPSNPNKLFVAMWEHQRWPWFFKSGGEGSGLFVTYDGGENWKKLTSKEGLPEGEIGRIGLAISRSNPEVVYALIEAKENALYRSEDGGKNFSKVGTRNIGDRPFYYADIFVDTKNENRVYTLFSRVNVSEDGGKTFTQLIGRSIHPDHHAWYIHPENPDFMINGNDGGMAITYDRGKTWRFVQNLPVGQFYHVRVDNELPYNVYGGMQDNGSWRGPAYTWTSGGIINTYWDNLYGGDGFDVLPDFSDPRYCYAMSQGGNVGRIDILTGQSKSIKPVHPEGLDLRFHWNAAIAGDPFDTRTIYYASQFLHKSTDRGESWEIISPDLTTNNPEKQKYGESGGLTYDVTGAETHTTIIAIAPSPAKEGVIWVGTDDGNIQVTQDGGKSWTNTVANIKGVPGKAWVPHIHASNKNAGEAMVVVNNYRQNDFRPYVYHTKDFGKKWTRLVDENKVFGYVMSIVQDPVAPELLFLGAEDGLYVSIDYGTNWTKWTNGFPTVSTMDLTIHPREHDLVIGTFGRSIYVLDDIRPLRELALTGGKAMEKTIHAFETPEAYMVSYKSSPGLFSGGNSYYEGENRRRGAMISYSVKEGVKDQEAKLRSLGGGGGGFGGFGRGSGAAPQQTSRPKKEEIVTIKIYDGSDNLVRTLSHVPKTGVNRIGWGFDKPGFRMPGQSAPRPGSSERGGGGYVLPGKYKLVFSYKDGKDSTDIMVKMDPRLELSVEAVKKNEEMLKPFIKKLELLAVGMERLTEAKASMDLVNKQLPKKPSDELKALKEIAKTTTDTINAINKILVADRNIKGIYRDPKVITSNLWGIRGLLYSQDPINQNQKYLLEQTGAKIDGAMDRINAFFEEQWKTYREAVDKVELTPFKEYEPLK